MQSSDLKEGCHAGLCRLWEVKLPDLMGGILTRDPHRCKTVAT